MDKFAQATTDQLYFRDPAVEPPPKNTSMLLLNSGGVCIIGTWSDDCIGWCPKPKIPVSIKNKDRIITLSQDETTQILESLNAIKKYGNSFSYDKYEKNPYEEIAIAIKTLDDKIKKET